MSDLTVIIPARNEMFLARTIEDILTNMRGDTEIIAVCDGNWPDPGVEDHPRVNLIYHPEPIGQRAAMNEAARMSTAKYLMKCDAHCAFDEGFDVIMMDDMQDDWTMVPVMKNLHAFDWVCDACEKRTYQGPEPEVCECGNKPHTMDIVWIPKPSPNSTSYRFTRELRFKYFGEYKKKQKGYLVETMSLQGSCFMATQDKYWELGLCDETWGSWGQQGSEVALKTWLSGGRVVCSRKTWYAHLFRTQKGFTWPWGKPKSQQNAIKKSKEIFLTDSWEHATHPLSWLIDKFSPVPDWNVSKNLIYYTDNRLDANIMSAVHKQIDVCANGHRVISVSLKPLSWGENITLELERGYLTMFKQILAGLEASNADYSFLVEHDLLYHPTHFEFAPPRDDVFYYNENTWKVDAKTGRALFYYCRQTSGLCASTKLLLEHYRKRVEMVERNGFTRRMGFEPGTHRRKERVDDYTSEAWMSEYPNIDIRHDKNLTPSRWRQDQFRNQKYCQGWTEADEVPGWGVTKGRFDEFISEVIA